MVAIKRHRICDYSHLFVMVSVANIHASGYAQSMPDRAAISLRRLDYQDWQPGAERVAVQARAIHLQVPLERSNQMPNWVGDWSLDLTRTVDSISGASPLYHSYALRRFSDRRNAHDIRLTRHSDSAQIRLGYASSNESDFESKAFSIFASRDIRQRTTSLHWGLARTSDSILSMQGKRQPRATLDVLLGLSHVASPTDLVQLNLSHSRAEGYLSDPYKLIDQRPGDRHAHALTLRWNRHIPEYTSSFKTIYRYYDDTYGIQSHTIQIEYAQPFWGRLEAFTLTPSLRYYAQTPADFYFGPANAPRPTIPVGLGPQTLISLDQRLSAFGARTVGLQLSYLGGSRMRPDFRIDMKWEDYEQRDEWQHGLGRAPQALPALPGFRARWLQLGFTTWY